MIGIAIANSLGLNFLRGIFGPYKSRVEADGGVTEAGQCVDAGATPLLQTASLLLIPSGYKATKLYSEIPTSGAGDSTWTRASNGTRTNSSGTIETMGNNVPRLDYSFGSCPGVWVEGQRTNLVFPSDTATTQTRTVTATAHTLSFYGTGTVVISGVATATLAGTGANDRVTLTFTPTAGSLILTVTGTVTNWQLESGAFASTLIPTTTASATRLVDTCNKTGISSLIGQTEGTFYAEIIASTAQTVIRSIGTIVGAGNYTRFRITAGNALSLETFVGGSFVGQVTASTSVVNGKNKVAFSYKNGEVSSMFLNGTLVGSTPTITTNPAGSELKIGMDNFNASPPFNLINQVALFTTRLTTAQCQALTTL